MDTESYRMPFGKWSGERLADIPESYFAWLRKQDGIRWKSPAVWKFMETHKAEIDKCERKDQAVESDCSQLHLE